MLVPKIFDLSETQNEPPVFSSNPGLGNPSLPAMVLATSNKLKQLLYVSYIGEVRAGDLRRSREEVTALLAELKPGFRLLVDLTLLASMSSDCSAGIGELMELMDQRGVGLVVRVIPDPKKDIGLNILTLFHYRRRPRLVNCRKLLEATRELSL